MGTRIGRRCESCILSVGRGADVQGLQPYLVTKAVHQYYGEAFEWPIRL